MAPIDPKTGKMGEPIDLPDAYNMYFTPDGRSAIVVAEAKRRLEFRDPHTMALQGYIAAPRCAGVNHADFALDGSYAIFTCEYDDELAKIDLVHHTLAGMLQLSPGHIPQDIRVAPDGSAFFVADMLKDGLVVVDGETFKETGFIPTGVGAHGLYPSRDGKRLYVSNRGTHNLAGVRTRRGQRFGASISPRARSSLSGRFRAAAAPTWATSAPTANGCGSPAATTASSTPSTRETARSRRSKSAACRTG